MAPEIIMLLIILLLVRTADRNNPGERIGITTITVAFVTLLTWGGFFNDLAGLIFVGFKKIFN